jgi:hypothetical protein
MMGGARTALLTGSGGFNAYLDSVGGNDANSGSAPGTAKRTWAGVAAIIPARGGFSIGVKRGSVIVEQCVLAASYNNIMIGAYGDAGDPLPLFDGSETLVAGIWSATVGQAGVWEQPYAVTGSTPGSGNEFRNIWEDNKVYTQATSLANCQATAGSCFFSSYTAASGTLYIHPYGSTDPTSDGKVRAWSKRFTVIDLAGANCVVSSVRTRRARNNNGSMVLSGRYGTIRGCTIEDGHKHVALMGAGATVDGCTFHNSYNGTGGGENLLVFFDAGAGMPGCQVINSTFEQQTAVVGTRTSSGIISHTANGTDNLGTITLRSNRFTRCAAAGSFSDTLAIAATNDLLIDCNQSIALFEIGTIDWTNCQMVTTALDIGGVSVMLPSSIAGSTINVTGCKVYSGTFTMHLVATAVTLNLTNNLLYAGDDSGHFPLGIVRASASGAIINANGNTFQKTAQFDTFYLLIAGNTYTGDHNHFVGLMNNAFSLNNGSTFITTLAAWRTASGQDANSDQVGDATSAAVYT